MISACLNGQTGPAQGLPGLRRSGRRAVRLQLADRLARPGAARAARHDHRLARAALRRHRARRRASTTAAGPAAASTSTSPRSRRACTRSSPWLVAVRRRPASSVPGTATARPGPSRTARSRALTRATSTDRWVAIAAWDDAAWAQLAAVIGVDDATLEHARGPGRARRRGRGRGRGVDVVAPPRRGLRASCSRSGLEAVPVEDFGDVHDDPQVAARGALRAASSTPSWDPGCTSTTGSGSPTPGRLRPGRPDARAGQRLGARRPCSASTTPSRPRLRDQGAVE